MKIVDIQMIVSSVHLRYLIECCVIEIYQIIKTSASVQGVVYEENDTESGLYKINN